jgi:hypothetical protein
MSSRTSYVPLIIIGNLKILLTLIYQVSKFSIHREDFTFLLFEVFHKPFKSEQFTNSSYLTESLILPQHTSNKP